VWNKERKINGTYRMENKIEKDCWNKNPNYLVTILREREDFPSKMD